MLTFEYINIAPNNIISMKRVLEALKIWKQKKKRYTEKKVNKTKLRKVLEKLIFKPDRIIYFNANNPFFITLLHKICLLLQIENSKFNIPCHSSVFPRIQQMLQPHT